MDVLELDALQKKWEKLDGNLLVHNLRGEVLDIIYRAKELCAENKQLRQETFSPLEVRLSMLSQGGLWDEMARKTAEEALGRIAVLKGCLAQLRIEARMYHKITTGPVKTFLARIIGVQLPIRHICANPNGCRNDPDPDSDFCGQCRQTMGTPSIG
jgi:hypothetical protein